MEALTTVGGSDQSGGTNRGRGFDFNVFASDLFIAAARAQDRLGRRRGRLARRDRRPAHRAPVRLRRLHLRRQRPGQLQRMAGQDRPALAGTDRQHLGRRHVRCAAVGGLFRAPARSKKVTAPAAGPTAPSNGGFNADLAVPAARSADVYHPRFPRYAQMEHEQKRLGITASLQWKPTDNTEFSLDALYSKIDAKRDEHYIEAMSFSRDAGAGRQAGDGGQGRRDRCSNGAGLWRVRQRRHPLGKPPRRVEHRLQADQPRRRASLQRQLQDERRRSASKSTARAIRSRPRSSWTSSTSTGLQLRLPWQQPTCPTLNYGIDPTDPAWLGTGRNPPASAVRETTTSTPASWISTGTSAPASRLQGGVWPRTTPSQPANCAAHAKWPCQLCRRHQASCRST